MQIGPEIYRLSNRQSDDSRLKTSDVRNQALVSGGIGLALVAGGSYMLSRLGMPAFDLPNAPNISLGSTGIEGVGDIPVHVVHKLVDYTLDLTEATSEIDSSELSIGALGLAFIYSGLVGIMISAERSTEYFERTGKVIAKNPAIKIIKAQAPS